MRKNGGWVQRKASIIVLCYGMLVSFYIIYYLSSR